MSFFVETPSKRAEMKATRQGDLPRAFVVPEGSLLQFPRSVPAIHVEDDVKYFPSRDWLQVAGVRTLELMPSTCFFQTRNLSLEEQKMWVEMYGYTILSPYDIAYLSALWKAEGRGRLFEGRVRTEALGFIATSHLGTGIPTVVARYDQREQLRFEVQYPKFAAPDLGALAASYGSP